MYKKTITMNLLINSTTEKSKVFSEIASELSSLGFKVEKQDQTRPWGGFFVLDESQAQVFAALYFPQLEMSAIQITNKLSPKILVVAPHKRLSWQYHFRRAEIWKVIAEKMNKGERHRLIGLDGWGVVAEIWQHTDPENPSDEDDIVRLQDDFGR